MFELSDFDKFFNVSDEETTDDENLELIELEELLIDFFESEPMDIE